MSKDPKDPVATISQIAAVPTILEVVCRTTGMGFAAVARVTEDQWIACEVRDEIDFGLKPGGELKIETTICNEIRDHGQRVVIDHVAEDTTFCSHPTPKMYGFQSYISVPIRRRNGTFFGTLCAIDPRPMQLNTPQIVGMFQLFADLIGFHLDSLENLARSEAALLDERASSELREQFIAVLGHDLRNPLASVEAGARLLSKRLVDTEATEILSRVRSSIGRMAKLIDNTLDFTHGRLGGALPVTRVDDVNLSPELEHVVAELRASWPKREIVAEFDIDGPINCDRSRLAQLLSNLLANALAHGDAASPVRVQGLIRGDRFQLSVINSGPRIPPDMIGRLFQPFFRGTGRSRHRGLGLGLYIAFEIARAHDGTLQVTSTDEETRFTFTMPA